MKKKLLNTKLITMLAILSLSNSINAQNIAIGSGSSLSICGNGKVNSWGSNTFGQHGNGTITNYSYVPKEVNTLTGVIAIAGGSTHFLALKNDNTVWAWGNNFYGMLGNGTTTVSSVPIQVTGITGITAINASALNSLALNNTGTVWAWGLNDKGQLGNGTNTNSNIPVQVNSLTNIIAIADGTNHSLALSNTGTVWAWGGNSNGQLGNGTQTNSNTPIQVSSLTGITSIKGGNGFSLALKNDGTVWAWGYNNYGQLGNGTQTQSKSPIQVSSLSGIIAISAGNGNQYSLALKNDGTIWAWGYNSNGSLGTGTSITTNPFPSQVSSITNVIEIAAGFGHSLAKKNDGTICAWGSNADGELGNSGNSTGVPIQVTGLCSVGSAIEENLSENLISVYPNPSSGIFQLTVDNMQSMKGELEIFNMLGEKVHTASNIKQQMQLDLSALSKGIYFVKIYDRTKIYNKKIVVQ